MFKKLTNWLKKSEENQIREVYPLRQMSLKEWENVVETSNGKTAYINGIKYHKCYIPECSYYCGQGDTQPAWVHQNYCKSIKCDHNCWDRIAD